MKIYYLNPEGVHEAEKEALLAMKSSLPDSWKGYASLELVDRQQGPSEMDVVIVTADRIIIVELKNWNGKLNAKDGCWYVGEQNRGRSPVKSTELKSKKLATKIRTKLKQKLKFIPWVDFCVVLCGTSTKDNLPDEEKGFVFSLDEFCQVGRPDVYNKSFAGCRTPRTKKDRPNQNLEIWDIFFTNNSVDFKPKIYTYNNYAAQGAPLFAHRGGIYKEFLSQRRDDANYRALMRRWNFSAPDIIERAQTAEERRLIGYRESKVLGYIDIQDDDLKNTHLGLLYVPNPDDITVDFCELYEWPKNKYRLDEFINKFSSKLTIESRLDLIQVLLSNMARLHEIDVAHRDIGRHSVWLSLPSKVTLSNFVTASYPDPDNKTMRAVRDILQAGQVEIPEDYFDDSEGTPYTRDVYLTAAVVHYIAFSKWPRKSDDIYVWSKQDPDPYDGKLDAWFSSALDIEAGNRFKNLSIALDDFNDIYHQYRTGYDDNFCDIKKYLSDLNVYMEYSPTEISKRGTSMLLRSSDEKFGIKIWNGVSVGGSSADCNQHVIVFLHRVQKLVNDNLKILSRIHKFGYNQTMQCLFVVYEWQNGDVLSKWLLENDATDKILEVFYKLLKAVDELHRYNIFHGDIHPDNIIVNEDQKNYSVSFIDFTDYFTEIRPPYNINYVPDNYENISLESRDKYAVVKIISEYASKVSNEPLMSYCSTLLQQVEISDGDITRFIDEYESIVKPIEEVITNLEIKSPIFPYSEVDRLVSDEGKYYITIRDGIDNQTKEKMLKVYVSGVQEQVDLHISTNSSEVLRVFSHEISHYQFIRNKKSSDIELEADIMLEHGAQHSAIELTHWVLSQSVSQNYIRTSAAPEDTDYSKILDSKSELVISTSKLWNAIVSTEEESYPTIIANRNSELLPDNDIVINYSAENGTLDFDIKKDTITVKVDTVNGFRTIGRVKEYSRDLLRVTSLRGMPFISAGDKIRLEGSLTAASLFKRKKAIESIINGRSIIECLPEYFDVKCDLKPIKYADSPIEEELEFYTEHSDDGSVRFKLNKSQRDAFKKLYSYGPVGYLQGPPGTGKTAFISSFIHYAIKKGAQHVLLVSQSHEAVNNATEKVRSLFARMEKNIDIVRLGDEGNISELLQDVHESALQEHYKDKFRAEYKQRIKAATSTLGLSEQFIDDAIKFESSVGYLIDSYANLSKIKMDDVDEFVNDAKKRIFGKISSVMKTELGLVIPDLYQKEIDESRSVVYRFLAQKHEITSPWLLEKFDSLVEIAREWLKVMSSRRANFQNFLVKTRTLVSGTCVGIGRGHYSITENKYDWVIIDEAARSTSSELAIAMQVGRRILLVGDHMQLPPIYDTEHLKAAKRFLGDISISELSRSDFERGFLSEYGKNIGQTLLLQYRMVPAIGNLVSHCFYKNTLENKRDLSENVLDELPDKLGTTVTWIDTSFAGKISHDSQLNKYSYDTHSYINEYEANTIHNLLLEITVSHQNSELLSTGDENEPLIGVICMYSEQKRHLVRLLNSVAWSREALEKRIVKIDTVDSYQGKENAIVIVSLVRNNYNFNEGFLSFQQRINVAISRAKERLYIIGSSKMWNDKNKNSPISEILKYIKGNIGKDYSILNSVNFNKEVGSGHRD